jgi:hypothetical protein
MTQTNTPGGWSDYQPGATGLNEFGLGSTSRNKHRPPDAGREVGEFLEGVIDGTIEAVELPWPCLSGLTQALMPQTVTVLCGAPGASKSFMVLQLLHDLHRRGVPVAYFAMEGERRDVAIRLLAQLEGEANVTSLAWCRANPERVRASMAIHRDALSEFGERVTVAPDAVNYDGLLAWMRERLARGARVLCIDPVTAASPEREPWAADQWFMGEARRLLADTGASLIVVTHPKKGGVVLPGMDALAGGAAWSRFSDTVLWLDRPDEPERVGVAVPLGGVQTVESNRSVRICKARNGRGAGLTVAFAFSPRTLTLDELGIVREGEGED